MSVEQVHNVEFPPREVIYEGGKAYFPLNDDEDVKMIPQNGTSVHVHLMRRNGNPSDRSIHVQEVYPPKGYAVWTGTGVRTTSNIVKRDAKRYIEIKFVKENPSKR